MKNLYFKDKKNRNLLKILEKKKLIFLYIIQKLTLSDNIRFYAYINLLKLTKIISLTKIKNRCILSNRSKSIYRKFKLSRIFLKQYSLSGFIMGIRKASW